jgi:hypothetical protein
MCIKRIFSENTLRLEELVTEKNIALSKAINEE